MVRVHALFVILIAAPVFTGCLGQDRIDEDAPAVAASAREAGAVAGASPSAAREPYQAQASSGADTPVTVTVYPLEIATNAAKVPYVGSFEGRFEPHECTAVGNVGLPIGTGGMPYFDLTDQFAKGDVFHYDVSLTFTNTDQSWGDIHLWTFFDGNQHLSMETTSESRGEIALTSVGQGLIVNDEFFAGVGAACWNGRTTAPIPFKVDVSITFAEGAVPSQSPVLIDVPAGATQLFVAGLPTDEATPVTSHFRLFATDDSLVCECALLSSNSVASLSIPAPGAYVLLVDHTQDGFVTLGLDAPPVAPLRVLPSRWEAYVVAEMDGGPVEHTQEIVFPSTALTVNGWVSAQPGGPADTGAAHQFELTVQNSRGDVLRTKMVGYVTPRVLIPGVVDLNAWYPIPLDGEWEFFVDHHAYDLGTHHVTIKADQMRGVAAIFARYYDRGG